MKVVSFFSGAGGLDLGFEAACGQNIFSSDILPEATDTIRRYWADSVVFGPPGQSGDVTDLTRGLVKDFVGDTDIDVMIGGPPCQSFSVAAAQRYLAGDDRFKRIGFKAEDKGRLVFEYARLIRSLRPKAFLIENVPGILTIDGGSGISEVYQYLEASGYSISTPTVVNAADYGVPQFRKRAFVIGNRLGKDFEFPAPTHSKAPSLFALRHISVAQALGDIPTDAANNEKRNHAPESVARYEQVAIGGRESRGRVDRLDPRAPSKTIIAGGSKGGGRSHLHPFEVRTLSVRECARLQTFPDEMEFAGSTARQFTLVGNAVPPLLAEVIAREIAAQFFDVSLTGPFKHSVPYIDLEGAVQALFAQAVESGRPLYRQ